MTDMAPLPREEYIEQAYFFRTMAERTQVNAPMQELLAAIRDETLATTQLPMALDFMLSELLHSGAISAAMGRLPHYFAPFQTYLIAEAENERGRFDMRTALMILRFEAEYRSSEPTPQGLFLYQFEALCRNRLRYDGGLSAMAGDPVYDENWRSWIFTARHQVGIVDVADLIYGRSEFAKLEMEKRGQAVPEGVAILFGEKEGRIAAANRKKDPLYLFSALQRQLNYPKVPRLEPIDLTHDLVPQLLRRVERMETRMKLLEDEQRETGIDLARFYQKPED